MIGLVERQAFRRQTIDVWRVTDRVGIVGLQVERRLVINNDEQEVGPITGCNIPDTTPDRKQSSFAQRISPNPQRRDL